MGYNQINQLPLTKTIEPTVPKAMQTATNNAKLAVTQMMKNHRTFACQISDDHEVVYPDAEQPNHWLVELFRQHLAPRQPNEKAMSAPW